MRITARYNLLFLFALAILLVTSNCFDQVSSTNQSSYSANSPKNFLNKGNFSLASVGDLKEFLTYNEERYPLVSAHRGGASKGYAENALETFEHIAKAMPVMIECDVRLSKDSVLVLMHDETLDRTTTGKGKVNDFTLDELKALNLRDNDGNVTKSKIPSLEEALVWGRGKVIFTLDIKRDVPYSLVSGIIEKTKAKPYSIVITYNANQARALYNLNPEIVISASIRNEQDFRHLAEIGIPDNNIIAFVGTRQPDKELIMLLHNHGVKTILGTLGNLDKQAQTKGYQLYADFVEDGADVISTDYPLEARKALDYYIRKRKLSSNFINN